MAYVNKDGVIWMNDVEVAEDISKLRNALNLMTESIDIINSVIEINSTFKGDIAESFDTSSMEIIKQIDMQKDEINRTINYINEVVTMYKNKDNNIGIAISSASIGGVDS